MQQKSSSIGCWIAGCGCAAFVAIPSLIVLATLWVGLDVFQWGMVQVEQERQRFEMAANWQPSNESIVWDDFFPRIVGQYELIAHDTDAQIPALNFDLEGNHATYQSGDSQIDVYLYAATELEKEALFVRIDHLHENQTGGFNVKTQIGDRLYVSSTHLKQNHLWWIKGWLLCVRTHDVEDRTPFIMHFLQATSEAP